MRTMQPPNPQLSSLSCPPPSLPDMSPTWLGNNDDNKPITSLFPLAHAIGVIAPRPLILCRRQCSLMTTMMTNGLPLPSSPSLDRNDDDTTSLPAIVVAFPPPPALPHIVSRTASPSSAMTTCTIGNNFWLTKRPESSTRRGGSSARV